MYITQLLSNISPTKIHLKIKGLSLNADAIKKGDLFIAVKGSITHGVQYANRAISNGCVAILVDSQDFKCSVPTIRVDKLKQYLHILAARFYPQAIKVEIVGITGTNGKTSVAHFISQLLAIMQIKHGVIGTLGISNSSYQAPNTTPDIFTLYKTLNDYSNQDINIAILEVSSHSLLQNRVAGLNFKQAIFTNLSEEHLDYHKTLDNYRKAKTLLFMFDSVNTVIINKDDNKQYFLDITTGKKQIIYGIDDFAQIIPNKHGFWCQLDNFIFETQFLGRFNLINMLAALNSVEQLGVERNKVIPLLSKLLLPVGRMHKIKNSSVWVDYAHTPDALFQAITALKIHYSDFKIKIIFGCGGNRDKNKRAKMGEVVSKLADSGILTNDNPRDEEPMNIINDIISGIDSNFKFDIVLDRKLAIKTTIAKLNVDECLLIAGKGHETVQRVKDKNIACNDIEIAQNALL